MDRDERFLIFDYQDAISMQKSLIFSRVLPGMPTPLLIFNPSRRRPREWEDCELRKWRKAAIECEVRASSLCVIYPAVLYIQLCYISSWTASSPGSRHNSFKNNNTSNNILLNQSKSSLTIYLHPSYIDLPNGFDLHNYDNDIYNHQDHQNGFYNDFNYRHSYERVFQAEHY